MTREFIVNQLNARGIKAEEMEVVKNNVVLHAISIGDGNVRPTIYAENYADLKDSEFDKVFSRIEEALKEIPEIDVEKIKTWDFVKDKLEICVQKKGNEPICKKDFLDMEMYIRVCLDENSSFKVHPNQLALWGVDTEELFAIASANTREQVVVKELTSMMEELAMEIGHDMCGIPADEFMKVQDEIHAVTLTKKSLSFGAGVVFYTDILKGIADKYECDLAIIPSSIHEIIAMPVDETVDFRELDTLIRNTNLLALRPEEVLADHAYRFIREENRIVY